MAHVPNGINGSSILIFVNTGTDEVPVYEAVGCQRGASIEESTSPIDTSCKGSRAQRVLPGRYTSTLSLESLYVPSNEAYQHLKLANRNGTFVQVAVQEDEVITETAWAIVTGIPREFPDQEAATISVELTIDGEWEEVGS